MTKSDLTETTKQHYEDLVGQLGEKYFHHRWGDHPVKRSHYQHTRRAIETIFAVKIGQVNELLEVGCGSGIWTELCDREMRSLYNYLSESYLIYGKKEI